MPRLTRALLYRLVRSATLTAAWIERHILEIAHEIAAHLGVERVGGIRPVQPDDAYMRIDALDGEGREILRFPRHAHTVSQEKPLPLRLIRPTDGEGKCAVQHSVGVSQ